MSENFPDNAKSIPRNPHDPTYAVIDKHVSTPTSSFFGTMVMQANRLSSIRKNKEQNTE